MSQFKIPSSQPKMSSNENFVRQKATSNDPITHEHQVDQTQPIANADPWKLPLIITYYNDISSSHKTAHITLKEADITISYNNEILNGKESYSAKIMASFILASTAGLCVAFLHYAAIVGLVGLLIATPFIYHNSKIRKINRHTQIMREGIQKWLIYNKLIYKHEKANNAAIHILKGLKSKRSVNYSSLMSITIAQPKNISDIEQAFVKNFLWQPSGKSKNMQEISNEVNHFLNKLIPQSFTKRSVGVGVHNEHLLSRRQKLSSRDKDKSPYVVLLRGNQYAPKKNEFNYLEDYFLAVAYHSSKYGIANCREYAITAYVTLKIQMASGKIPHQPIHMCDIKQGDHAFLIIGGIDTKQARDQAIICDPWSNRRYPLNDVKTKLKNYSYNTSTKKGALEDLDEHRHSIRVLHSWIPKTISRLSIS